MNMNDVEKQFIDRDLMKTFMDFEKHTEDLVKLYKSFEKYRHRFDLIIDKVHGEPDYALKIQKCCRNLESHIIETLRDKLCNRADFGYLLCMDYAATHLYIDLDEDIGDSFPDAIDGSGFRDDVSFLTYAMFNDILEKLDNNIEAQYVLFRAMKEHVIEIITEFQEYLVEQFAANETEFVVEHNTEDIIRTITEVILTERSYIDRKEK